MYEPFDARTRDLLGQDLEPCWISWMINDHLSLSFLFYYSIFDVFGTCCLGGLL